MTAKPMLTKALCLTSSALIISSATAQTATLVTGHVTNSYMEGSHLAVELDQPNNCGSSKYVSKDTPAAVAVVQEALTEAAAIEGVITINVGACVSGGAEIDGIAYGPDL